MKKYKVDLMIGYTVGRYVRDTIYTPEKVTESEAIRFAKGIMKLQNNMLDANTFFVYNVNPA